MDNTLNDLLSNVSNISSRNNVTSIFQEIITLIINTAVGSQRMMPDQDNYFLRNISYLTDLTDRTPVYLYDNLKQAGVDRLKLSLETKLNYQGTYSPQSPTRLIDYYNAGNSSSNYDIFMSFMSPDRQSTFAFLTDIDGDVVVDTINLTNNLTNNSVLFNHAVTCMELFL